MADDEVERAEGALDARLREAGLRWREGRPPRVHLFPVERVTSAGPRPPGRLRRWSPAVVAASVAVIVGAAVAVGGVLPGGGGETGRDAGATTGDGWDPAVVPGAVPPLRQDVTFPAVEVAGRYRPATSEAVGHPGCEADDVVVAAEPGAGDGVTFVMAAADDAVRCALSYYPSVEFTLGGDHVEVLTESPDPEVGDWPADVLVTSGRPAVLRTQWAGWCADPRPVDTALVFLGGNDDAVRVTDLPEAGECPGQPVADDAMHWVGWEPQGWVLEPAGSFDGVEARLVDTVTAADHRPTWVVELRATTRDVTLDPCPVWSVRVGSDRDGYAWNRLNCAGVPDRRADGTAYLPRGKRVRFAFFVTYGAVDAPLTWEMLLPGGRLLELPLAEGASAPVGEPRVVDDEDANLHLYVSNQSFDEPSVDVTVTMDGHQILSQGFDVKDQHHWVLFPVAAAAGRHTLVVTSDTGAVKTIELTLPERGDRWTVIDYWTEPEGGVFSWYTNDTPVGFL